MRILPTRFLPCPPNRDPGSTGLCTGFTALVLGCLLAGTMALSACGGGSSSQSSQIPLTLSGNWQFTVASPADGSFLGGLQGGFLLQETASVKGSVAYSVSLPPAQIGGSATVCNSGSAPVTGTLSGQGVTLTAVAGTQTFTFTGTLSFDGSTMAGTYASTAGTAADGSPCGTAQSGLQWSAALVPPMTGSIQGSFHSSGGTAGLNEQDFLVTGSLAQAGNTGASNASITGTLSFMNTTTNQSDYPCISLASVTGQISGNTVNLSIGGNDGSNVGQIGVAPGSGLQIVTFDHIQGGNVLHSLGAPSYAVFAAACGGGSLANPADSGNLCLAVNSTAPCAQPITLTPSALVFPPEMQGTAEMQTVTLANSSRAVVGNLTLALANDTAPGNFTETDDCGLEGVPSQGESFSLNPAQSCVITITFTPQCGLQCSSPLNATLTANSPGNSTIYTLPITGTGISSQSAVSTAQPDLGSRGVSEARLPVLSFTGAEASRDGSSSGRADWDLEHHAEID